MPGSVGMNVEQVILGTEMTEPCRNAVRVHPGAVIPYKHIRGVCPTVSVQLLQPLIFYPPLPQNRQCLRHNFYGTDSPGFGGVLVDASVCGVQQIAVNNDNPGIKIHLVPFQSHDLTPAASGVNEQVGNGGVFRCTLGGVALLAGL